MAQFVIGFAAGVYIGTYYNCRPGLKLASDTLEQYCPKREPPTNYVPINANDDPIEKKEIKKEIKKEKNIEMKSLSTPVHRWF